MCESNPDILQSVFSIPLSQSDSKFSTTDSFSDDIHIPWDLALFDHSGDMFQEEIFPHSERDILSTAPENQLTRSLVLLPYRESFQEEDVQSEGHLGSSSHCSMTLQDSDDLERLSMANSAEYSGLQPLPAVFANSRYGSTSDEDSSDVSHHTEVDSAYESQIRWFLSQTHWLSISALHCARVHMIHCQMDKDLNIRSEKSHRNLFSDLESSLLLSITQIYISHKINITASPYSLQAWTQFVNTRTLKPFRLLSYV